MRIELDYIAAPRRPLWPGVLLLAVSIAIAGALGVRYHEIRAELKRLETAGGLITVERRAKRVVPRERLEEEAKSAEAVVRQLTLPWASLVETIEEAATRDVAILQLQPDAQQRLLRLSAEARNQEAMLEYLRRLVSGSALTDVHVVSHQVQMEDPQRPIQFSVQASLRSAP